MTLASELIVTQYRLQEFVNLTSGVRKPNNSFEAVPKDQWTKLTSVYLKGPRNQHISCQFLFIDIHANVVTSLLYSVTLFVNACVFLTWQMHQEASGNWQIRGIIVADKCQKVANKRHKSGRQVAAKWQTRGIKKWQASGRQVSKSGRQEE